MGFDEGRILLDRDDATYYTGQVIRGKLEFEQSKVKTFRGKYRFNVLPKSCAWPSTRGAARSVPLCEYFFLLRLAAAPPPAADADPSVAPAIYQRPASVTEKNIKNKPLEHLQ